ncbi:MAG: hypothetical protein ACM65L_25740 [Microcoleus sp.]
MQASNIAGECLRTDLRPFVGLTSPTLAETAVPSPIIAVEQGKQPVLRQLFGFAWRVVGIHRCQLKVQPSQRLLFNYQG